MSGSTPPQIQSYRPRSFRARGVAAPFTTPILSAARLRRSEDATIGATGGPSTADELRGAALEVLVPNPAGGRGVYILQWSEISALCRPTMHDVVLGQTVDGAQGPTGRGVSPGAMRTAARQVASLGLAGRLPARAAVQAMHDHTERLTATRFTLLMETITQTETGARTGPPLAEATPAEIERRGGMALGRLAAELGQPADAITTALDLLADCYAELGIGFGLAQAYIPRLLASLGTLRHDLISGTERRDADADHPIFEDNAHDGRHGLEIAGSAELAIRMASKPLADARSRVENLPALIRDTLAAPAAMADLLSRPSWLLDGWERVCKLWQATPGTTGRSALLSEIARDLPVLPEEAEVWLGLPAGTAMQLLRRHTSLPPSPGAERVPLDQIARNEQLRAMTI